MKKYALTLVLVLPATGALATVLEDFESGNIDGYSHNASFPGGNTNPNGEVTNGAAYSGQYGLYFRDVVRPPFYFNSGIATNPGMMMSCKVFSTNADGRIYVGVGGNNAGAFTAVVAYNTGQFLLDDNTNWEFNQLASANVNYDSGVWYTLDFDWQSDGTMVASLWDDSHTNMKASVSQSNVSLQSGGLTFRGFSANGGFNYLDDINAVPEPTTFALLGLGAAALLRRKRKP